MEWPFLAFSDVAGADGDGEFSRRLPTRRFGVPTMNRVTFSAVSLKDLRVVFDAPPTPANFRLIELKAFAP